MSIKDSDTLDYDKLYEPSTIWNVASTMLEAKPK